VVVAAGAIVAAVGASGPAQAKQDCKVQDVSGAWHGEFQGQVMSGAVFLNVTQDHRRFHIDAFAPAGEIEGDGTIAASGESHFNGAGGLVKKVGAKGVVQGDCQTTTAEFQFDAIYVDGTHDSGTVTLTHDVDGGGGGT
jgi:hypothetical protein